MALALALGKRMENLIEKSDRKTTEKNTMKKLPIHFRKDGFDFNQVSRAGDVAIYRQTKQGQPANVHFEVGWIRSNPAREVFGKVFEASESWPCSEEWGIRAWTYGDLDDAKKRGATLILPGNKNA